MTPPGTISTQAPAAPDAGEARHIAGRRFSRPIYHDRHDLRDQIWSWLGGFFDVGSMIPGAPSQVPTLTVALVVAAGIALLTLLLARLSSAHKVATLPSLSIFADDYDADALTRVVGTAVTQVDLATAIVERFRTTIRSLDKRGIIDEYPGMTVLEAATLTHQALGEHRVAVPLYRIVHLFDAILYGRVISTSAQDQQMCELADQMTTVRLLSGRALVDASVRVPGMPA